MGIYPNAPVLNIRFYGNVHFHGGGFTTSPPNIALASADNNNNNKD
jgi:hypothetical protein